MPHGVEGVTLPKIKLPVAQQRRAQPIVESATASDFSLPAVKGAALKVEAGAPPKVRISASAALRPLVPVQFQKPERRNLPAGGMLAPLPAPLSSKDGDKPSSAQAAPAQVEAGAKPKVLLPLDSSSIEEMRERRRFLLRLNSIAAAIPKDNPLFGVADVEELSHEELLRHAKTGRWVDIAPTIRLDWGKLARARAIKDARTVCSTLQSGAGSAGSAGAVDAYETKEDNWNALRMIRSLLILAGLDEAAPDLSDLAVIAKDMLGDEIMGLVASSIPFLSTIVGSAKAANALRKAIALQTAKGGAEAASDRLRPGTPAIACTAVIQDLEYYRNVQAEKFVENLGKSIVSLFDGGLASGPAGTLASLAVSVHGLYRSYQEKQGFDALIQGEKWYDALKRSATVSAFVLVNYPAIGLMDPVRAKDDDLDERVERRLWFLWKIRAASQAEKNFLALRKAGNAVLGASRLNVRVA